MLENTNTTQSKEVGPAIYVDGWHYIHQELAKIIDTTQLYLDVNSYNPKLSSQRVTVIITYPKSSSKHLESRPGHVGIALWNTGNYRFTTTGIAGNGHIGVEYFQRETLNLDDDFEVWYFTKSISSKKAEKMLVRMKSLGSSKTYGAILSNRFLDSYNCVTVVDSILWAGGESWGIASSASTPYMYSCTFGIGWTQSRIDRARHM